MSTSWNVLISAKRLDQTTCRIGFCATLVSLCAIPCDPLACIFNSSIKAGIVPSIWKRATDRLQWNEHVSSLCSRAAQRLHFLQQLKRAAMSSDDLLYYHQSVVRPVTEYACVVWHTSLTQEHTKQLESIQKRAMKFIYGTNSGDLPRALVIVPSLAERREWLTKRFFSEMSNDVCTNYFLRSEVIGKLWDANKYRVPWWARTERIKESTMVYALNHYQ